MGQRGLQSNKRSGILICGSYGLGNTGDEAILKAILREARSAAGGEELTVLSRDPAETTARHGVAALHMFDIPGILRAMGRVRLYINGGGSLIQDATSRRSLLYYLFTLRAARWRGCKVLMYGCGIGPVSRLGDVALVRRVLNTCVDAITLREDASLAELRRFGVDRPETVLAADPVLSLQPAPQGETDALMARLGLDPAGAYLGVCLRTWKGFEDKAPVIADAVRYARDKYGLTPVFLSVNHITDGDAADLVCARLDGPAPCVLRQPLSSELMLGLTSRMQAVISMRLHGLIFAAGQGVPLVGITYDPKVSGFLSYMGQELYQDLDLLTCGSLRAMLDQALALRDSRDTLHAAVERLRRLEQNNSDVLRRLLADGDGPGVAP